MDDSKMAREGDLLETQDGLIFDVKGFVHPPDRVIAFPRFIPSPEGDRKLRGRAYKKIYALSERFEFLEEKLPHYLVSDHVFGDVLCEVPQKDVRRYYDPANHLINLRGSRQLDLLETDALRLHETLHSKANVTWSSLGISGSLLAGLHTVESDIDPIVYGTAEGTKVHESLEHLTRDSTSALRAYSLDELRKLYCFRRQDTRIGFDDFVKTERRKVLQGKFGGHDYFIRFVRDWAEIDEQYGDSIYCRTGYARIKASVTDDSESIFTPCRYPVETVRVLDGKGAEDVVEVASFRGRFCEQARTGETIIAQGKTEKVQTKDGNSFSRLLLGSQPSDFMVLET
jgi:predicted nucleotidyltransferase